MKTISMMKALRLCNQYQKLSPKQRKAVQAKRLQELVAYAKENSPYYGKLYADIPEQYSLSDLPPTNKRQLIMRTTVSIWGTAQSAPNFS